MRKKKVTVLAITLVLSWIVFIGLCIKAGSLLCSFVVSLFWSAEGAKNLYMGLDLHNLLEYDRVEYIIIASLLIAIEILKAYTAYLVLKVLMKTKLANPFTIEISKLLDKISYFILGTWVLVVIHNNHEQGLLKKIPALKGDYISQEFILLAGVVFVIAQIFKRGVEIQSENELTV